MASSCLWTPLQGMMNSGSSESAYEHTFNSSTICCEQHFRAVKAYLVGKLTAASSLSPPSNRNVPNSMARAIGIDWANTTFDIEINFHFSFYKNPSTKSLCYPIH